MVNGVGAASDCIPVDDYIAAEDRVVMDAGESRKEACSRMEMFTHPKECENDVRHWEDSPSL